MVSVAVTMVVTVALMAMAAVVVVKVMATVGLMASNVDRGKVAVAVKVAVIETVTVVTA